jgi:hypothetical protein
MPDFQDRLIQEIACAGNRAMAEQALALAAPSIAKLSPRDREELLATLQDIVAEFPG